VTLVRFEVRFNPNSQPMSIEITYGSEPNWNDLKFEDLVKQCHTLWNKTNIAVDKKDSKYVVFLDFF